MCDASAIGCELYCVWLIVVVMVACANYSPMSPWSAIFSLDHYSWPYGDTWKYWWGIIGICCCLSMSLLWWSSSQSLMRSLWSITGMMLQTCLLNINLAGLCKPWPNGIIQIWRMGIFMSLPGISAFYEFYTGFNLSIALMVVCWWYHLLYINWFTELPEPICNKVSTTSDIIWGGYHTQQILFLLYSLGCLLTGSLVFWWLEICCCNLQYTSSVYFLNEIHLHQQLPMAWVVCCNGWSFLLTVFAEIQDMWHNALCSLWYQHLYLTRTQNHGQAVLSFLCPCGSCVARAPTPDTM